MNDKILKNENEHWTQEIEHWINYFSDYIKGFSHNFTSASEKDLKHLENLAGLCFPPDYRAFLLRLGRTPYGANPFLKEIKYNVGAIEEFYTSPTVPIPPDVIYIGIMGEQSEMFIDMSQGQPGPVVIYEWEFDENGLHVPGSHKGSIYHDSHSLIQFIYGEAFRWLRTGALPYSNQLSRSTEIGILNLPSLQERIAKFRVISEALGFSSVPYMNHELAYYNRNDASLMFYPHDGSSDSLTIHSKSKDDLKSLIEYFSRWLEMR